MKRLMILFALIVLLSMNLYAQVNFPKDWQGNYLAATLYSGSNVASADTSGTLTVPFEVKQAILYLQVDTVTAADTLKNIYVQGSPDGSNWYNITTSATFSDVIAAGGQRVVATLVDRYIRLVFAITGTDPAIDFTVKVTPK